MEKKNTHGKITKPMKIYYKNLKINPIVEKIQNYTHKWIQGVRQMDRDILSHLLWNTKHVRDEAKDDQSKDFWTGNVTGIAHETQ